MRALALIVANLVAIAALIFFFDSLYRQYRLDLLRHYLFQARDSLFFAAERGEISFESRAYGMVRQMLNGWIRYGHKIGFWRTILMSATQRWWEDAESAKRFADEYHEALSELSSPAKKLILSILGEAHLAVLGYALHTSMFVFPFVFFGKWVVRLMPQWSSLRHEASQWINQVNGVRRRIPKNIKIALDHHAYVIGGLRV